MVGRNAFSHESGIHQHGVLRDRETYEIMDPKAVGAESQIVLGKHSGRAGFADALQNMEISLEDEQLEAAFQRFKDMADRKVEINEREIRAIVREQQRHVDEVIHLVSMSVAGGSETTPKATVQISRGEEIEEYKGEGDGMVHATFAALKQAFGIEARLVDYRVVPVTSGADAMAEVNVVVRIGAKTWTGRSVSTDVVEGSAHAFVEALNMALKESNV